MRLGEKVDTSPILATEYRQLRQCLATHWRLLYDLLWFTGLRITEALMIQRDDLIAPDTIVIHREKKRSELVAKIPIPGWLWQEIATSISRKHHTKVWPYTQQAALLALKRAARESGVRTSVHPHSFRHSVGRRLTVKGVTKVDIAAALGHSSTRYVDRYSWPHSEEVGEIFKRLH